MRTKDQLRKKFLTLRKKKYFDVSNDKLSQLVSYIKKNVKRRKNFLLRYTILQILRLTY